MDGRTSRAAVAVEYAPRGGAQRRPAVLGTAGLAALVAFYHGVPALRGGAFLVAAALAVAGLLAVVAAAGLALPPRVRSAVGWGTLAVCPFALLAWVVLAGVPAGAGSWALGAVLFVSASAGLVLAARGVRV
jgi:hypothetical protein